MAGLRTASTWVKIALVTLIIAIILFVVGFATVAWVAAEWYRGQRFQYRDWSYWSIGLWKQKICDRRVQSDCYQLNTEEQTRHSWFQAGQAMECLGIIFLVIAFILLILYTCVNSMKRRNPLLGVIFTTIAAVLFIGIGVAIFIVEFGKWRFEVSWSMGLAIGSAVFAFISGLMSLIEFCSSR